MGNLNKVFLIGRIGQDPESRTIPSGQTVVNFSLATSESYKDKSGQKQEKTEWHRCQAWARVGEIIQQYTRKGSQIYVEGSLQTREWQDKDGNKRYTTEIVVRNLQLLDSKPNNGQANYQPNNQQYQQQAQPQGQGYVTENPPPAGEYVPDDVPF